MSKFLKYSLVTLSAVILLFIMLAISLIIFINPNKYKPQITHYIQAQTGRELQIKGDMSWTFLPRLGLKVSDVQLGNPTDFPKQAFAHINEAEVNVALFPLLKKHIVAEQLLLKGLQLNLIKNKAGAVNWQITIAQAANRNGQAIHQAVGPTEAAAAPLMLNIAHVKVADSALRYLDQQTNKQYNVSQLQFDSKDVGFNHFFPIDLKFKMSSKDPALTGDISLEGKLNVDPQQQAYQLSPVNLTINLTGNSLPNGKVNLAANTAINATRETITVKPFKLVLDKKTTITGEANKNLKNQLLSFNLNIPELNLPKSQPTDSQANKTTPIKNAQPAQATAPSPALLPIALLKDLKANGSMQIGKLTSDKLVVKHVKLNLNANNGIVQLAPIQANLFQGSYQGQISMDARSSTPSLTTQQNFKNVQLGQLLSALGKQGKFPLRGIGNIDLQLSTLGNGMNAWINNLAGNANFAVTQGVIENINVEYQLQRIRNRINKEPEPQPQGPNQTTFDSLTGTFKIASGVANNSNLLMQAKTGTVTGQGSIDFRNQTLNYRIQATAQSQNLGSDAYKIQEYLGGGLPIIISGQWENPSVNPDWNVIGQAIAKALVKQQTNKLIEKHLGADAGKKLQNALSGLLK